MPGYEYLSTNGNSTASTTTWSGWNSSTSATVTSDVWITWTSDGTVYQGDSNGSVAPAPVCQVTPAQAARMTQQRARLRRQHEQADRRRERERVAAQKRARSLLLRLLSRDQARDYDEHQWFQLQARSGRVYRIHRGRTRNVVEIGGDGSGIRRFCIHPEEYVPDEDTMLAQKLMLENDEERFLAIANENPY